MTIPVVYGPVPSRRLGHSLGINNIPPKNCTYSCVYCQLGRTSDMDIKRKVFYQPLELARSVNDKIRQLRENNEPVDYLAFVPDGEPTLDINLGKEIDLLQDIGIKIAVITNSSLLWYEDVRRDLLKADWVSLKVDAVTPKVWHRINRPYKYIKLDNVLEGMADFARVFTGELTTETMLVKGFNDEAGEASAIAGFIAGLKPARSYLSMPTRPPAEQVAPPNGQTLNNTYQVFSKKLNKVEYLTGYEGNTFTSTGDAADDLLSITAVHPMREDAVAELLNRLGSGWETVQRLITDGKLIELEYRNKKFYARKGIRR